MCVIIITSAENNRTGIPKALAKPKSANFNPPFLNKIYK